MFRSPPPRLLNVTVTQGEAMIEPNRVLDDGHRESVAVWLWVGHGRSAYLNLFEATQPILHVMDVGTGQRAVGSPAAGLLLNNGR